MTVDRPVEAVVPLLEAAGMVVTRPLSRFGIVGGRAGEDDVSRLEQLPGVVAVEVQRDVHAIDR